MSETPPALFTDLADERGEAVESLKWLTEEDEFQEWLAEQFRDAGWDVEREAESDNTTPNGGRYKADLIIRNDLIGDEPIGIECKYVNSLRSGSSIGRALQQITNRYGPSTFGGEQVDLWAVCPFIKAQIKDSETDARNRVTNMASVTTQQFVREMLCQYGIGFLSPAGSYAVIDFGYSVAHRKVPAFGLRNPVPERHLKNVDLQKTVEAVREKRTGLHRDEGWGRP